MKSQFFLCEAAKHPRPRLLVITTAIYFQNSPSIYFTSFDADHGFLKAPYRPSLKRWPPSESCFSVRRLWRKELMKLNGLKLLTIATNRQLIDMLREKTFCSNWKSVLFQPLRPSVKCYASWWCLHHKIIQWINNNICLIWEPEQATCKVCTFDCTSMAQIDGLPYGLITEVYSHCIQAPC